MKSSLLQTVKSQETLAAYMLLAPDILGLLLVYIGPMIFTVYISFQSWTGIGKSTFVGLENYVAMFSDAIWLKSLGVTLKYILIYVPLIVAGSLILALLTNIKLPEIKVYRTLFFFPIVVPIIIAAVVWQFIFEPSYGILNYILGFLGISAQPWLGSEKQALFSVVIISVWKQVGYYMIIYLAGLGDIPSEYYEASQIDGANSLQKFYYITLPLLKPVVIFVLVVNMISALQDFDQVYVLTRGGPNYATHVQVFYIYEKAFKFMKMGIASSASVVLFSIIFLVSIIQLKLYKGGSYE